MGKPTLKLDRSNNLHSHDGFQNSWLGQLECFTERTNSGKSESQLGGINGMEGTILENEATSSNRVARQ